MENKYKSLIIDILPEYLDTLHEQLQKEYGAEVGIDLDKGK